MHNHVWITILTLFIYFLFFTFHIVASNIPVLKEVEAIMDPAAFTVVRFGVSAIAFIPFVLQARDDVQTRNSGIELGFWVSLGYLMQAFGLMTSDAGRASFISMFTVSFLDQPLCISRKVSCSVTIPEGITLAYSFVNLSGYCGSIA